jgi:hypothetical protein
VRNWLRHYATSRKVVGSVPVDVIGFSNWPNLSSPTLPQVSTHTLTECVPGNLPGGKGRPARKADNLTAMCELII